MTWKATSTKLPLLVRAFSVVPLKEERQLARGGCSRMSSDEEQPVGDDPVIKGWRMRKIRPYRFEPRKLVSTSTDSKNVSSESVSAFKDCAVAVAVLPSCHVRWCRSSSCEVMTRPVDCRCCCEIPTARVKMPLGNECITSHLEFEIVCLHPAVLKVCLVAYREFRGRKDDSWNR